MALVGRPKTEVEEWSDEIPRVGNRSQKNVIPPLKGAER